MYSLNIGGCMVHNKFMYFSTLSTEQHKQYYSYLSPVEERSLFKGIPVTRVEEFKTLARVLNPGRTIRVRFRGPREGGMRDYCLKRKARSVAIYVD
jgi:hypothetical protein